MRTRANALPELTHYIDTGCAFHPACLHCPEPACLFEPGGPSRAFLWSRRAEACRLHREGWSILKIGDALGRSRRTVFRLLAAGGSG